MKLPIVSCMLAMTLLLGACQNQQAEESPGTEESHKMKLVSDAFEDGDSIPVEFTCDGADESPPLRWYQIPDGTVSLALICEDPDAPRGTWVHWVLFNIPVDQSELTPGLPATDTLQAGMRQGTNDFRKPGYGGPCPPPGKPHRYFFKLYALDGMLELSSGISKGDLEKAMQQRIIAEAELMGTYGR